MIKLGIVVSDDWYFLASRYVDVDYDIASFEVRMIKKSEYCNHSEVWYINEGSVSGLAALTGNLRPVITLKSDVKFSGTGTEKDPYTFD